MPCQPDRAWRMLVDQMVFLGLLVLNVAVVVLLQRVRTRFPPVLTAEQKNIVLGPFAFVVTLYAFLLSFVVLNLWQTFTQAERTVELEAETVAVLYRLALGVPGQDPVRQTLRQYIRSIVQDEWPAMAAGQPSLPTEALYNQLWQETYAMAPATANEQGLHAEYLSQLSELAKYRRDRLLLARGSVPTLMWAVLAYGGLLLLAGLYYLAIGRAREQLVIDFAVIAILGATVYLSVEFSAPFRGDVQVSPQAFEVIEAHLAHLPP